jgi:ferritin-like metal-binding protein YciE
LTVRLFGLAITAANAAGETEVAEVCEQNLQEEVDMAEWLINNLEPTTTMFLTRAETGRNDAKR